MQILPGEYTSFVSVTKSDTTLVNCRAIYIGSTGDVALSIDSSTTAVTFVAPGAGTILPIQLNQGRIMSTNTSATVIIALQ